MPFEYDDIVYLYNTLGNINYGNIPTHTKFTASIILDLRVDVDYLGNLLQITGSNWTSFNYDWTKGTSIALEESHRVWKSYITDLRLASEDLRVRANVLGASIPVFNWGTYDPIVSTYDNVGDIISPTPVGRTDRRHASIYETIRSSILTIISSQFLFVDAVNGNDTTGDGTAGNPYKTWDKVVTEANSLSVGIYFMPGIYTCGTAYTVNNGQLTSGVLGGVLIDVATAFVTTADGVTISNLFFGDGTVQNVTFFGADNLDVDNCIFRGVGGDNAMGAFACKNGNFKHCTFIGNDKTGDGAVWDTSASTHANAHVTFDSCAFVTRDKAVRTHVSATFNVTENYCAFYDFNTKNSGGANFIVTNEFSTTQNPQISNIVTCYLSDISPYIDEASDGFDIGGYPNGPYNVVRTASDTITIGDSTKMSLKVSASDLINITENVLTADMSVSIDMFLSGLFASSNSGVISYLTESDVLTPTYMPDLVYNGAALDVSWDNPDEDLCKAYIVIDDGITDYNPPSWWIINADYPAISTTQVNGTRGYGIDLTIDAEIDEEWGDQGDFSTVTADGVNDKQWDIALKVRIHNTIKDEWSEVVSLSKTYNFNDFDKTMYFGADNPRVIANEYADHANYYADVYHIGTAKYTRPDGIDWSNDNRRHAYNPMFKMQKLLHDGSYLHQSATTSLNDVYQVWKDRKASTLQPLGVNAAQTNQGIYAAIFVNYGNWNNTSAHCFASPSTTQPFDGGTANFTSPILSSASSDIRYLQLQAYAANDCAAHSSNTGYIIRTPDGGNYARNDFTGKPTLLLNSEIYYVQADNPYEHCLPDNNYYLLTKANTGGPPGGFIYWHFTNQLFYVNTDSSGNLDYGWLSPRKQHQGNNSFADSW